MSKSEENAFFSKPFNGRILIFWNLILYTFLCTKIKKFTIGNFFSLDACSSPMWGAFASTKTITRIFDQHWWLHKSGVQHHWLDWWWRQRGHVHSKVADWMKCWICKVLQLWKRARLPKPDDRGGRKLHTDRPCQRHSWKKRISTVEI